MTSSLEGEGGGLDTPQKWWRHLVMTWWQGGGGGVWIPPKSDDVIYEQPLTTINISGRCYSCLVQRRKAQRFKMSSFNLSPGTKVLLASDQLSWVGGEQLRTMSRLVKNWFQFDIAKVVNFNKYSSIYWSFRAPFCFVSPSVFFHLRR